MLGQKHIYDPDSLLTGEEIAKGFTYANSHREFPNDFVKTAIIDGNYETSKIPVVAPRVFNSNAEAKSNTPLPKTQDDGFGEEERSI